MRVLVTGGFGYLGGRIAQALCDADIRVVLGSREERKAPVWLPQATTAELKWGDQENLQSICEQVDAVIHTAGINAQDCANDPVHAMEFNAGATARLIHASALSNVKKFIYLSTVHIYCSPLVGVITEDTCPLNRHPYAVSHRAAEDLLLYHVKNTNMVGTVLRLSNSVGAPANKQANCWMLAINDFCKQVVVNGRIFVNSSPFVQRDFFPISTLCDSIIFLLNSKKKEDEIINVVSSKAKTLQEIIDLICQSSRLVLDIAPSVVFKDGANVIGGHSNLSISNNKLQKITRAESNLDNEINNLLMKCRDWFA